MSLLFLVIGFILTESNSRYLLAGYNMMSEEERSRFDIKGFLKYFRQFHVFLAISLLVFGLVINHFFNDNVGGMFLAIYPCVAYIVMIIKGNSFKIKDSSSKS